MNEIWKQIKDFPKYEVSNYGRVKSNWYGKSKIRVQKKGSHGYFYVTLCDPGKQRVKLIHRLVLETFIGECPDGMEGSHLDGDRLNNCLDNLVWETRPDNGRRRTDIGKTKLNKLKVSWIRLLLERGWSGIRLAREFNVSTGLISTIKHNKVWKIETS